VGTFVQSPLFAQESQEQPNTPQHAVKLPDGYVLPGLKSTLPTPVPAVEMAKLMQRLSQPQPIPPNAQTQYAVLKEHIDVHPDAAAVVRVPLGENHFAWQIVEEDYIQYQIVICEIPENESGKHLTDLLSKMMKDANTATQPVSNNGLLSWLKQLENDKLLTILNRPQIMTCDRETAHVQIGNHNEETQKYSLMQLEITPHISWDNVIRTKVGWKISSLNEQDATLNKAEMSKVVAVKEGVPFFVEGLVSQPAPDQPQKQLALIVTAKRCPPQVAALYKEGKGHAYR
jgi:hypothetical protein